MDSTSARPSRHQDEATAGQDEDNVYGFQFDDRGDHPSSPEPSGADESQDLPIYDDPDGSMFSGPVAEVTPSSVTTMHLDSRFDSRSCRSTRSRRQGTSIRDSRPPSRRKPSIGSRSVRSRAPSKSNRSHRAQDDRKSEAGVSVASSRRRADLSKTRTQDHIPTTPTEEPESGFFNNLSAFLKGKGRSRSRDSRASSNRENYHYHTVNNKQRRQSQSRSIRSIKSSTWRSLKSNRSKARSAAANTSHESDDGWPDETDSLDRSSSASSNSTSTSNSDPSSSESSLLNRRTDGLNDHRIEVIPLTHPLPGIKSHSWHPSDIEMTKAQRLSTQSVYIIEDDLQVQFLGWRSVGWRVALWWLGSVMSAGVLWLVGRWKVAWRLKMGILEPFNQASHVVAYTEYGQPDIIDLQTLTFNQPVKLSTLCPPSLRVPPTTKDEPLISLSDNTGVSSSHPDPIGPVPQVAVNQRLSELYLTEIRYIDFRYHRFLLHPITQIGRASCRERVSTVV